MAEHLDSPLLAVVPGERAAEELFDDVALFTDTVWQLPAWGTLPFEHVSPNMATMARRAEALHRYVSGAAGTIVVAGQDLVGRHVLRPAGVGKPCRFHH